MSGEKKKFLVNKRFFRITWSKVPRDLLNPRLILDELLKKIKVNFKYVIGEEHHDPEGDSYDKDKPLHYHAFLDFGKGKKFKTTNCRFFDVKDIHPSLTGSFQKCYPAKEGNYITNFPDFEIELEDYMEAINPTWKISKEKVHEIFYPIIDLVSVPQMQKINRSIIWIYSQEGGKGKSLFINYLLDNIRGTHLFGGKYGDMARCMLPLAPTKCKLAVIDIPRKMKTISYAGLEGLADGHMFSWKNDSMGIRFRPPHIIVCANFYPEPDEDLSEDRFNVFNCMEH